MLQAVGQCDMSIQEVMYQIQSLKLHSYSYRVVCTSFEGNRKVSLDEAGEMVK